MTSPDKDVAAIESRLTAIRERADTAEKYVLDRRMDAFWPKACAESQQDVPALLADIAALLAEVKRLREGRDIEQAMIRNAVGQIGALEAERDRYRAAWQSARRRAKRMQDVDIEIVWQERDRVAVALGRVRELSDQWARDANQSHGRPCADHRLIIEDLNGQLAEALDAEPTDPGCPHCGDPSDPDQPDLHARCRRIPDAEARRDGRDG